MLLDLQKIRVFHVGVTAASWNRLLRSASTHHGCAHEKKARVVMFSMDHDKKAWKSFYGA